MQIWFLSVKYFAILEMNVIGLLFELLSDGELKITNYIYNKL